MMSVCGSKMPTSFSAGGTFSPHDGQVSPLKAAVAFERAAERHGALYRFHERVVGYHQQG